MKIKILRENIVQEGVVGDALKGVSTAGTFDLISRMANPNFNILDPKRYALHAGIHVGYNALTTKYKLNNTSSMSEYIKCCNHYGTNRGSVKDILELYGNIEDRRVLGLIKHSRKQSRTFFNGFSIVRYDEMLSDKEMQKNKMIPLFRKDSQVICYNTNTQEWGIFDKKTKSFKARERSPLDEI